MLRSIYLKSLRDHWVGGLVGALSLAAMVWMGLYAWGGLAGDDFDAFVGAYPPEILALAGIDALSGPAGLMLGMVMGMLGPFVLAGLAVSWAASALAGEESTGTMESLGSVPRSRTRILSETTLGWITLIMVATVVTVAGSAWAVVATDTGGEGLDPLAGSVHLIAGALFFGTLAMAVGAFTGRSVVAGGAGAMAMILAFLVNGLAPLLEQTEFLAKASPWFYISDSEPLLNGIHWGHLSVLLGGAAAFVGLSVWGYARRDLRTSGVTLPIVERVMSQPMVKATLGRLIGHASARSVLAKAWTDAQPVLLITASIVLFLGIVTGAMYPLFEPVVADITDVFPDSMLALFGNADFSSAEGWTQAEVLSITTPAAAAVAVIAVGTQAIAAEDSRGTLAVVLSAPISRASYLVRKAALLAGVIVAFSVILLVTLMASSALGGMGLSMEGMVAASLGLVGFSTMLGGIAFGVGAATGRSSWATWSATGIAVFGWAISAFVAINPDFRWVGFVSPFFYMLDGVPIENGIPLWQWVTPVAIGVVVAVAGSLAFLRRDLRK